MLASMTTTVRKIMVELSVEHEADAETREDLSMETLVRAIVMQGRMPVVTEGSVRIIAAEVANSTEEDGS